MITVDKLTDEMVRALQRECFVVLSQDSEDERAQDVSHACHDALVTDDPPRREAARQIVCDAINAAARSER